jgi:hypothetical protein
LRHVPEVNLDYFFDRLLPRELPEANPRDETDVAIKKKQIFIVGREDRGKDNTAKWIENEVAERYGLKRLAVDLADAENFGAMLRAKWQHKDIQFKIINDAGDVGIPSEDIHSFFTIRHEMEKRTGFRSGLIVTLMLTHRLWDTPASMREGGYDCLMILNPPAKRSWDWRFLVGLVGEDALIELGKRDEEGQLDVTGEKKGYVLVIYEDNFLGMTKVPRSSFIGKVREIGAEEKPEKPVIASGRKQRAKPVEKVPLKEELLLLTLILLPWLGVYLEIRYRISVDSLLAIVVLSAMVSVGYVAVRGSRWFKARGKK